MYILYRYNILPENRINNPTNPSLYAIRFKELAKKSFYFNNDRLYYIKKCEIVRYDDGSFENKDNVILKKFHIFMKYYLVLIIFMIYMDIYLLEIYLKNYYLQIFLLII